MDKLEVPITENTYLNNNELTSPEVFSMYICEEKARQGRDFDQIARPDFDQISNNIWPVHGPTVAWMHEQELSWGRLFSQPYDIMYPFPEVHLVETFAHPVVRLRSPAEIRRALQELAEMEQQRVERLEEEVQQVAQAKSVSLQADVIKSTAERMARMMANEIAQKRSEELNRMILDGLDVVLQMVADVVPEDVNILHEIDQLRNRCLSFAAGNEEPEEGDPENAPEGMVEEEPAHEDGMFAGDGGEEEERGEEGSTGDVMHEEYEA